MANDGRRKLQSAVIVSSTLNIFNVKADVSEQNLGSFSYCTPVHEMHVLRDSSRQGLHALDTKGFSEFQSSVGYKGG